LIIPHLITRVSGHLIFLLSMVAFLVGNIVMSVARENASYWGTIFPAFVIAVFGPGERLHRSPCAANHLPGEWC